MGDQEVHGDQVHGGQIIVRRLKAEGVDTLFTLTGGHISALYDGVKLEGGMDVVDVRHEQAAAHAADGYARLTRNLGVAAVTAGPGLSDAITGVANAYYADSPVVLLAGRNPLGLESMGSLQDAPQLDLLKPVTKRVDLALETKRLAEVVGYAVRHARSPRQGPTFVDLPMDVLMDSLDGDEIVDADDQRFTHLPAPAPDAVADIADLLGQAERPVVLSGSGTYWAGAEEHLRQLVETARCPLYVNSMSRGILPADHEYFCPSGRGEALRHADLIIALGIDFDFRLSYGRGAAYDDGVKVVHVDPQADKLGHNRKVDYGVVSDVRRFLEALLDHDGTFASSEDTDWMRQRRVTSDEKMEARRAAIDNDQTPIHPNRFAAEIARFADEDAVLIGDGGDIVAVSAGVALANRPGHWMDPGPYGCLGVGAPFALAAGVAKPDVQRIVIYGDGSFGLNGFELESAARQGLPFVGIIGNDGAWGEMRTFHEQVYGSEGLIAQELSQDIAYETVAEGLGGHGERVTDPDELGPAFKRAADAMRDGVPAIVNVILDPTFRRGSSTAYS